MTRGRPIKSKTREKIIALLHYFGDMYGYEIYKRYKQVFGKTSLRLIYYHLNKGVQISMISKKKIEIIKGDYSWGNSSERIYYCLGKDAKINTNYSNKIKNKLSN